MTTASLARIDASAGPSREVLEAVVRASIARLKLAAVGRTVAVYIEQQFHVPALVRVSPDVHPRPADGYSIELRFASWLSGSASAGLRSVPTFLSPWLAMAKALVVPLDVDGFQRGAIVVEASHLGRNDLDAIAELEVELCEKLAELEHSAPRGPHSERVRFAHSVRRIKTLV